MNITPITLDIMTLKDPNVIGEALRAWAFPGPGYGCYSNFDVRPDFVPVSPKEPENRWIVSGMLGRNDDDEVSAEFSHGATAFLAPNGLVVTWYWDGDGLLAFLMRDQFALTNSDCKKSDEWSMEPLMPGLVSFRDFNHMSNHAALAAISHPEFREVNRMSYAIHTLGSLVKFEQLRREAYDIAEEIPSFVITGNTELLRLRVKHLQDNISRIIEKYRNAGDLPILRSAFHILNGIFTPGE